MRFEPATAQLWSRVPTDEFVSGFAGAWDALNASLYKSHPLFDSRFVFNLVRHFRQPRLAAYVLGDRAEPRGMVLLEPHRIGVWRNFQRSQAEASPLMISPADVDLLSGLFRTLPPHVQAIDFFSQDPNYSPWRFAGTYPPRESTRHILTAGIELTGKFDVYWAQRPRGLRQTIARCQRRAAEEGFPLSLKVIEDARNIDDAVVAFARMESRGWKAAAGTAVAPGNAQERFYRELFGSFSASGQAIAYELHCGPSVVARQLALVNDHMLIFLKTAHAEDFRRFSPGRVLDYEILKFEFGRQKFPYVELYTDADELQLRWTTDSRWIEHVTCFRSNFAHMVYSLARLGRSVVHATRPTAERSSNSTAASHA